ncbi:MAG: hypothetical protein A2521_10835 [Deltaproteobacteria bacterium RIFOXYD12_FULL_57_12]|nr:MAG: hypothetical protein A2521_10835 [Deltaproteobacteria bacterium RIFOXYD12_FULL_57_12]
MPETSWFLAVLFQLEESQWWPAEKIAEYQFRQLNQVAAHALETVPFYQARLRAAGIRKGKKAGPEQWQRIPPLKRFELQQNEKNLLSRRLPKEHGKLTTLRSSGSTGKPVQVAATQLTNFFWQVFTLREHFWRRRDFSGTLAAIRHFAGGGAQHPGLTATDWGPWTAAITRTGPSHMLNSNTDIGLQAAWLLDKNPDYFLSYPSNLKELADYFIKSGLKLPRLREIRTMGEVVDENVRAICQQAWDVPLADIYTAQEIGYIALQCPQHAENYHVQSENLLVEVLNDHNQACRPGEIGKVAVTTLHNYAMPLIRYEVGDYAEVGTPCPCGRGLPVLSRVLGRQRNMLVLPDGRRIWPTFGVSTWAQDLPIIQFQFVQKDLERIEARLVTSRPLTNDEEARLISALHRRLTYPFQVDFTYMTEIPRSSSGKFEDFMSDVARR